jgi:hypothetical protein
VSLKSQASVSYLRPVRHLGDGGDKCHALLLILFKALEHSAIYDVSTHGYKICLTTVLSFGPPHGGIKDFAPRLLISRFPRAKEVVFKTEVRGKARE